MSLESIDNKFIIHIEFGKAKEIEESGKRHSALWHFLCRNTRQCFNHGNRFHIILFSLMLETLNL